MLSLNVFFKKRYFASAFFYSCFSLIFSTWVIYIPYVAEKLGITEGKIGGAIFCTNGSLFNDSDLQSVIGQDWCRENGILFIMLLLYCPIWPNTGKSL